MVFKQDILFESKGKFDFLDITEKISEIAKQSKIKTGIINVQSLHTTMAIIVNENEPLLLSDIKNVLEKVAPENGQYNHDNFDLRGVREVKPNGHAHCKAAFLGPSVCLNIVEGELNLGTWQRVFALELDRPRSRQVSVVVVGE